MQRQRLGGRAYDEKDKSLASSITGKSLSNELLTNLLQSMIFYNLG